jgi:hypothetical protein
MLTQDMIDKAKRARCRVARQLGSAMTATSAVTISMEIPPEWLAEAGLQNFKPLRSSIRCAAPHVLIALDQIEPLVRNGPIDANGFRRSKPVLECVRDDLPLSEPIYVARRAERRTISGDFLGVVARHRIAQEEEADKTCEGQNSRLNITNDF